MEEAELLGEKFQVTRRPWTKKRNFGCNSINIKITGCHFLVLKENEYLAADLHHESEECKKIPLYVWTYRLLFETNIKMPEF